MTLLFYLQPQLSMQETQAKLVSVIIPALHRPDLTERCIASLRRQTIPSASFDIVVVENEARPETNLPQPSESNIRVIELAQNLGTTGSINRGCAESTSKYVLLLNNDVELQPDFLENLIAAVEQDRRNGFVTGKLLSAKEKNRLDGAGDAVLAGGGVYRIGHGDLDVGQYETCTRVIAGCGAATLFRRSVFEEVGGLDDIFFAYIDDVDLGFRVHLYGYQGQYLPKSVAYHIGSATLGGESFHPKIVEWITRNQILLLSKDYPLFALLVMLPRIFVFQLLWLAVALRRGLFMPYLKGVFSALGFLPATLRKRRTLMKQRRIADADFLSLLRESELQVYRWHKTQSPTSKSSLLKSYFFLFGNRKNKQE